MDDSTNSGYSRAPEVADLVSLCKSLNECKVEYILIGGFAVILHGNVRSTKDIDLLVEPSEQNIIKLKKGLSVLPDHAAMDIGNCDVKEYEVVRVADEIVIDLMAKACGIDFGAAKNEIQLIEVDGVKIPVASKELLIRMKDTVRHSDKLDSEFLRWRLEEETAKSQDQRENQINERIVRNTKSLTSKVLSILSGIFKH